MKQYIILLTILMPFLIKAQTLNTVPVNNWNNMRLSGFYESITSQTPNLPNKNSDYYWGINIAHTGNKNTGDRPYHWGGQMLFEINRSNQPPVMYIRSTNELGDGIWAKVLHNKGNQSIEGDLNVSQNINAGGNIKLSNGEITYVYNDNFDYDQKKMGYYSMKWIYDSWNPGGPTLWQSGLGGIKLFTGGKPRLVINATGDIGIGTENPQTKLDVRGVISATEVRVQVLTGADHVFDDSYNLKSLSEVEQFVQENKHLPEIPSQKQMQEEGLSMNEFQIKLLQKIEELTLYVIDLKKENQHQGKLIEDLQSQLSTGKN